MTETTAATADSPLTSTAARIGWATLILATLYVCYFSHLGAIGVVGPDEPRYAWIARDMVETGDWVTPRLYGKPWFEKPPLFYWGAALCFKLFGVSEAAARLPSAISALLATLALAWLALRLYGAETARWLLLLLPTTVGMIGFSHAAATDMPFSAMLTIAMVCAAVVVGLMRNENTPILPRTPWPALFLFGFFLGLAVLAKGPAAIILSGGALFSSGRSSPSAGATPFGSLTPPPSRLFASLHFPGTFSAPAATPTSSASSSSNTISSATSPPNSSTSSPSGFISQSCLWPSCRGPQQCSGQLSKEGRTFRGLKE